MLFIECNELFIFRFCVFHSVLQLEILPVTKVFKETAELYVWAAVRAAYVMVICLFTRSLHSAINSSTYRNGDR